MTTYKVLWPYITIKVRPDSGGTVLRELYQGAPAPDNADPDDLARLVRKGALVEEGTYAGDVLAVPAGNPIPGEPPNVSVTEQPANAGSIGDRLRRQQETGEQAEKGPRADGRPLRNQPKDDWVAYAVTQRAEDQSEDDARATAEAKSKSDLIAEYGG